MPDVSLQLASLVAQETPIRAKPRTKEEKRKTYRLQSLCPVIPSTSALPAGTSAVSGLAAGDVGVIGGVSLLSHRKVRCRVTGKKGELRVE